MLSKTGAPITVLDPTTGHRFPNGLIPANQISPQAAYFLKFFPMPQFTAAERPTTLRSPLSAVGSDQLSPLHEEPAHQEHDTLNMSFVDADNHGSSDSIFNFLDLNRHHQLPRRPHLQSHLHTELARNGAK